VFAYGGSIMVTLFGAGAISFDDDLETRSREGRKTLVTLASSLGRATGRPHAHAPAGQEAARTARQLHSSAPCDSLPAHLPDTAVTVLYSSVSPTSDFIYSCMQKHAVCMPSVSMVYCCQRE
jgi:hypothetical protein